LFERMSLSELNAQAPLSNVFFDYDQAELLGPARATLQQNAEWLQRWSSTRIIVEGHCDERGTNEYNLGLGERRAQAVREYLTSLGIAAGRVTMVSKGEEEPVCTDETESCWTRNRRGNFIITAK
tara:strand:- start:3512 stop:3886 length:375 start_codon:yes stop_codon:yes gene_type:complete